jgi:low affinity Fe/Cu permease
MSMEKAFAKFSGKASKAVGSPYAFVIAGASVLIWAATGPLFHFGETWQLVINTGTTIVTFLMVFLIQNSQNRDSEALQLKLDEVIFALSNASDDMIDIEKLDQKSLDALRSRYEKVLRHAESRQKADRHS